MELLELFALVANGYVVRYYRAPQVLECWLLGPLQEVVPFDKGLFEQVCDAARAKEASERILHKPLPDSGALESYGFRPYQESEVPAIEPESLLEEGILEVIFAKGKNRYRYHNVSRFHLQQFLKAASKRDYLLNVIAKECSNVERVSDRPAVAADTVRLELQQSIDALAPDQKNPFQALYDSAGTARESA